MGLFKKSFTNIKNNRLAVLVGLTLALVVSLAPIHAKAAFHFTPDYCSNNYSCELRSNSDSSCMWVDDTGYGVIHRQCGLASSFVKLDPSVASPGTYYIHFNAFSAVDKCLTVRSTSSGDILIQTECRGYSTQRWYFNHGNLSYSYRIRSFSNGMYAYPYPPTGNFVTQQHCGSTDQKCDWELSS